MYKPNPAIVLLLVLAIGAAFAASGFALYHGSGVIAAVALFIVLQLCMTTADYVRDEAMVCARCQEELCPRCGDWEMRDGPDGDDGDDDDDGGGDVIDAVIDHVTTEPETHRHLRVVTAKEV